MNINVGNKIKELRKLNNSIIIYDLGDNLIKTKELKWISKFGKWSIFSIIAFILYMFLIEGLKMYIFPFVLWVLANIYIIYRVFFFDVKFLFDTNKRIVYKYRGRKIVNKISYCEINRIGYKKTIHKTMSQSGRIEYFREFTFDLTIFTNEKKEFVLGYLTNERKSILYLKIFKELIKYD